MTISSISLVRHGQASAGTHDYDRLSPLGQQQASLLGKWWKEHGMQIDAVCCGSLSRQRHTAELALEAAGVTLELQENSDFNEYDHRRIERHFAGHEPRDNPEEMSYEEYASIITHWRDTAENLPECMESWTRFSQRGWQATQSLHEVLHATPADTTTPSTPRHLVCFTSGGIIATVLSQVLALDLDHTIDAIWRIRNTSVTTLHFDGTQARLVDFNTIAHLQVEGDPALISLI